MGDVTYRPMMSSTDAIIWDIEADPRLQSTVMIAWELDSTPTPDRMSESLDRMIQAIPRLRQRVVEDRPRPRWVDIDDLDLSHHFVSERLPAVTNLRDALAYAENWVAEPFDRDRPLWRLALLTGLPGGRSAVIIKVHHAIADGMGMLLMLGAFTDLEPAPRPRPPVAPVVQMPSPRSAFSARERLRFKIDRARNTFTSNPVTASVRAGRTLASAGRLVIPHRKPLSQEMTRRSGDLRMDSRQIAFRDMKAAASAADVSINDLFVTVVAEALRLYHARRGVSCGRLRVHIPVNSRTERTAAFAGNDFVPARISLRITPDGDRRATSVRDQLTRLRNEPALHHINTVSAIVQKLGKRASRWIIGGMMQGVDVLASNVPGPSFPLYLAGAKIDSFVAFGPPAGAAVNITLLTYDGVVSFGITADKAAVGEPLLLAKCLDDAVADLVRPAVANRHLVAV